VDATFRLLKRYGDWRIVDLGIGAVGVTSFFRQQFESLLRTDTPEQLIARLRDHNARMERRNPLDPNRKRR
jgi:ABC-type transporter MlaC component